MYVDGRNGGGGVSQSHALSIYYVIVGKRRRQARSRVDGRWKRARKRNREEEEELDCASVGSSAKSRPEEKENKRVEECMNSICASSEVSAVHEHARYIYSTNTS